MLVHGMYVGIDIELWLALSRQMILVIQCGLIIFHSVFTI